MKGKKCIATLIASAALFGCSQGELASKVDYITSTMDEKSYFLIDYSSEKTKDELAYVANFKERFTFSFISADVDHIILTDRTDNGHGSIDLYEGYTFADDMYYSVSNPTPALKKMGMSHYRRGVDASIDYLDNAKKSYEGPEWKSLLEKIIEESE